MEALTKIQVSQSYYSLDVDVSWKKVTDFEAQHAAILKLLMMK